MLRVVVVGDLGEVELGEPFQIALVATARGALAELDDADVLVVAAGNPQAMASLLDEARTRRPSQVRIAQVPSDGTELGHLRLAHLVLENPADVGEVIEALVHAAAMRGRMEPGVLTAFFDRFDALPGVPAAWADLNRLLADPDATVVAVTEAIGHDAGLAAQVLRLANSAALARGSRVATIRDAVVRLGFSTISSLALTAEIGRLFDGARRAGLVVDEITAQGMACGVLARTLVTDPADREAAFLTGLLAEIGQLVLGGLLGRDYASVRALAAERGWEIQDAEAVALGVTHAQVAEHLLAGWGLPEAITTGVAGHHDDVRNVRPIGPAEAAAMARRAIEADGEVPDRI